MNTVFSIVAARSPALGEGSLAVVRVFQDAPQVPGDISVESNKHPEHFAPPVTSRT